jgi:AcrR family transcriptional regulator
MVLPQLQSDRSVCLDVLRTIGVSIVSPSEMNTRQMIMDQAKRLFSVHGYHETSLGDILTACGLTKGGFYHHFKTKEELAVEILDQIAGEYQRELIEPAMAAEGPRAQLVALLDGVVAVNRRPEWCNCRLMMTFSAQMSKRDERLRSRLRQTHESMFTLWRGLLIAAQHAGEIPRTISPKVGAQLVMTAVTGALQADKVGLDAVDLEGVMAGLKATVLGEVED